MTTRGFEIAGLDGSHVSLTSGQLKKLESQTEGRLLRQGDDGWDDAIRIWKCGLTLDMSRMRDVSVDPESRLAHVGPGCLPRDVDRATQAHGCATVLGFVSDTGVAGLRGARRHESTAAARDRAT